MEWQGHWCVGYLIPFPWAGITLDWCWYHLGLPSGVYWGRRHFEMIPIDRWTGCVVLYGFILGLSGIPGPRCLSLPRLGKFSAIISSNNFSGFSLFPFNVKSFKLCSLFKNSFSILLLSVGEINCVASQLTD